MRLLGKRVERQNKSGDDYCVEIHKKGQLKLSPALISALGVNPTNNRIGFAYPDTEGESLYIYRAVDGNGVAVNKQGYVLNIPHWRDLKSHFGVEDGAILSINGKPVVMEEWADYTFFEVYGLKNPATTTVSLKSIPKTSISDPQSEDEEETYSEQEAKIQAEQDHKARVVDTTVDDLGNVKEEYKEINNTMPTYNIENGKVQKEIVNNAVEHVEASSEPSGDSMDIF